MLKTLVLFFVGIAVVAGRGRGLLHVFAMAADQRDAGGESAPFPEANAWLALAIFLNAVAILVLHRVRPIVVDRVRTSCFANSSIPALWVGMARWSSLWSVRYVF